MHPVLVFFLAILNVYIALSIPVGFPRQITTLSQHFCPQRAQKLDKKCAFVLTVPGDLKAAWMDGWMWDERILQNEAR